MKNYEQDRAVMTNLSNLYAYTTFRYKKKWYKKYMHDNYSEILSRGTSVSLSGGAFRGNEVVGARLFSLINKRKFVPIERMDETD